jgi:hypothetical protein
MKKLIILFIIFSLFTVNLVFAKSSDLFIEHLTNIVYDDCVGKDMDLKEPYIKNTQTNEVVTSIPWPYDKLQIRRIIELLGVYEPYNQYYNGCAQQDGNYFSNGKNGCGIFKCEDNKLDINQYNYFWNDERVDVPREEYKTTYGSNSPIVETHGDNRLSTTGDNSPINQQENNIWIQLFLSKGTLAGAILGFIMKILYDIWKKKYNKRKKSYSKKTKSTE